MIILRPKNVIFERFWPLFKMVYQITNYECALIANIFIPNGQQQKIVDGLVTGQIRATMIYHFKFK